MLNVGSYIDELIQLSKGNLRICRMNWWLLKYEDQFRQAIDETTCKKWQRWFYNEEHPFPCVCPRREKLCVFIDLYRELDRLTQVQRMEQFFEDYFQRFQLIKDSSDLLRNWMSEIRPTISSIYLLLWKKR